MKISITDVPQADELSKVIATVEAVSVECKKDREIAEYVGFSDRQGRYYRLAAEILGLLNNQGNNASLSEQGEELVRYDDANRLQMVRAILRKNSLFNIILNNLENSEDGLSRQQIQDVLDDSVDGAESTKQRRLTTVLNWLLYSGLIITDIRQSSDGDAETVYKISESLDETDFETREEIKDSIYPTCYPNEELDIREIHIQVVGLLRKKEQQKIVIPEFQRNVVWKEQQKSRFIESLILNIPIPPLYVSEDLEGNLHIVDGLQRFAAIDGFLSKKYKLVGLEALPDLEGLDCDGLSPELRTRIEDRQLLLYVLKPTVPISVVYDIFNRINANGTPLTRQEIRNCIYIGNSTTLLYDLSINEEFKKAVDNGIPSLRMKDREAILRFFAFSAPDALSEYKKYNSDMDGFLGKTMRDINRMSQTQLTDLSRRFIRAMKLSFGFFGDRNFRLPSGENRGIVNMALFEAVSVFFDKQPDTFLVENKGLIIHRYFEILLHDGDFRDSVKSATNSESKVYTRHNKTFEILTSH